MKNEKEKSCVVLVSGGLDSACTLAFAKAEGFRPFCLTVRYGQRHSREIDSARRVCAEYGGGTHRIIDIDLSSFGGSALTSDREIPQTDSFGSPGNIPATYVPARNTVFLSLALAWAEAIGARDIFIGVSSVDYSGYPDCRPEFIRSFVETANLGTRAADGGPRFEVHTPLIELTKGETIELGFSLGVDFGLTWSCYDPLSDGSPCEKCESCRLRARGFEEAGALDPIRGEGK